MSSSRKVRVIVAAAVVAIGTTIAFAGWQGGASAVDVTPTLRVGGHYQGSVKSSAAVICQAPRLMKIKRSVAGPDRVVAQGTTVQLLDLSKGVLKVKRPYKAGTDDYYSQVYLFTPSGYGYGNPTQIRCLGGKSPRRELRNSPKL